jgi:hypothetical protein
MRAFAIGCMMPNIKYTLMVKACISSIRRVGHQEDIVVVTIDPSLKDKLADEDCEVRCFDVIRYPYLDEYLRTWQRKFRLCDAQKIHFWRLTDYEKVLAVDADVTMWKQFAGWDGPELQVRTGSRAPVNTGIMLLQPNERTVQGLLDLTQNFDPVCGWSDRPSFTFNGREWRWDFQGAFTAQGYLFYYFYCIRRSLHCSVLSEFLHWSGDKKQKRAYLDLLLRHVKL